MVVATSFQVWSAAREGAAKTAMATAAMTATMRMRLSR